MELGLFYGIVGIGLAVGLAGAGSSIGVGLAGKAGAGVLAEDPDKFGGLIILVALPGTQGIYGLLAGILIFLKLHLGMPAAEGIQLMVCALPIALTGLFSGIHQGKVCAAGVQMTAKRPEAMMKSVIFGALVETYAVLGLIMTILMLYSKNVWVQNIAEKAGHEKKNIVSLQPTGGSHGFSYQQFMKIDFFIVFCYCCTLTSSTHYVCRQSMSAFL